MTIGFPSRAFDEAVAAAFDGTGSSEQTRALHELLRANAAARDEYLFRAELHSRLASQPDLFASTSDEAPSGNIRNRLPLPRRPEGNRGGLTWALAAAACVTLLAAGWWGVSRLPSGGRQGATSKAVAMLNRVVDAEWNQGDVTPALGAPLEPGWLRLKSGLAQIVFYSGARVVIEGAAEVQLVSPDEAVCTSGRLVAEVPPQAKGFRVRTPQINVTDLGTVFGVQVRQRQSEVHIFKGSAEVQSPAGGARQTLLEGRGAVAGEAGSPRLVMADPARFASLFTLHNRSSEAEVLRHEQWRAASNRLDEDPSLLVHFDFEQTDLADWRLPNTSKRKDAVSDATIVGCQWTEGRWADKRALEFRGVSDRVRLSVPGEFDALTLAAWVRVQGLDRQINALFMSDGFAAGTVHWSIRRDGVLGLTAIGSAPGRYQISPSPPVLTLDQFGLWIHLAVVIDGGAKQVIHYLNGIPVSENALDIHPPYRVGVAELGNWNAQGFPRNDPFMIRHFSGAIDEFCLFSRVLDGDEIRALHAVGKPQPDSLKPTRN